MYKTLIFLFCLVSRLEPSLFIFWGYPTDGTDKCEAVTVVTFEECTERCLSSDSCMLVYGNDDSCELCDLYSVTTITQSNSESGTKTAVKVDEPNDGCPNSMLSNKYTRTDIIGGYNLSYSGGTWSIEGPRCQVGWKMFDRASGLFCLKVFSAQVPLSRYAGTNNCTTLYSSNICGFDSLEEKQFILDTARNLVGDKPEYLYTPIWLSGGRKNGCNKAGYELLPECAGIKMFEQFTYQSNYDVLYTFASGYPTTAADSGASQNCLGLLMGQANTTNDGKIFNAACGNSCNAKNTICGMAYVCGNPAVI